MRSNRLMRLVAVFFMVMALKACSDDTHLSQVPTTITGNVLHGEDPVEGSTVTLYSAGSTGGAVAIPLGTAQTDAG